MGLVQSGWLNTSVSGSYNMTGPNYYWLVISDSQNQHVGRDGVVRGATIYITAATSISAFGFVVLRLVSGTTYTVIGKSEEITGGFTNGLNTFTFANPITGCHSTNLFALAYKGITSGNTTFNAYTSAVHYRHSDTWIQARHVFGPMILVAELSTASDGRKQL